MAEIELRGVSKRFAGNVAVNEATFTIRDGEFFILVGPSGCGKSTLLNMIVGLEAASDGDIFLDGVRINDVDPKDRNMAMVFQSYALYPHMTVRENMAFPLRLAGMVKTEIERRVAQTAETLELTALLDRKPAALSGGQRQRVAMGRAIVREPAVFLLDEPLSNLDAKLRAQMRTEIARLQRRLGTTTVYVTHDQTEAMTLGDRIAVLRKGEAMQIGTPRDLYERPATLFVAGFIGSPAMNFLPARSRDGALELPVGTLELSGELRDRVAATDGALVAGIRADHLQVVSDGEPGGLCFEACTEVVEWLGTDAYIYVDVALSDFAAPILPDDLDIRRGDARHRTLVARVDPRDDTRVKEGETLRLRLDPRHVHVFDAATGRNLLV